LKDTEKQIAIRSVVSDRGITTHLALHSHVLIPRNLSVLSSTKTISYIIIHHKYSLYCITEILQFTDVVCTDVTLKL
jgi:hypothetical protein